MKYVCRVVVMLALWFAYQVNVKGNVVFTAGSDYVEDGAVTKDGITISGLKDYYCDVNGYGDYRHSFGSSNISVISDVGQIVMIGICYSPFDFRDEDEGASNKDYYNMIGHTAKEGSSNQYQLISVDVSNGFIENGDFSIQSESLDFLEHNFRYSVWQGSSSSVNFNFDNAEAFIRKIYIYLEGDELPVKKTFTISYYEYTDGEESGYFYFSSLGIYYGYGNFINGYYDSSDFFDTQSSRKIINEGESLPKYKNYFEGNKESYDRIYFDSSFLEYKPKNISHLFQDIKCNEIVDFSNLDLSEVNDASYMFNHSDVNVENLRISEGKNLCYMFSGYSNEYLDIASWDFSSNTVVTGMFYNSSIQFLKVGPSINNARNDIFNGLGTYSNPCKLEIIGNVNLGQEPGDDVFYWKGGYFILPEKEAYVSVEENREYVDGVERVNLDYTFRYDSHRSSYEKTFLLDEEIPYYGDNLKIKKWVDDFNSHFVEDENGDWKLKYTGGNITLRITPSFADYRPTSTSKWFARCFTEQIDGLEYINTSKVTDMSEMFSCCSNLTFLDVSNFDTSKVTDMSWLFSECGKLTSLNISNFDTSNVTDMTGMLSWLNITSLDLSQFNTSNVRNMSGLFWNSNKLKTLDLSNFDTSNVTDMSNMFSEDFGNLALLYLDVSSFNTYKVTDMSGMFVGCGNLTSLNVSNFDTSSVTNMESMFRNCSKLTSLDVSNFNTSNVTDMSQMFSCCSNLTSLDVSNFDTSNLVEEQWSGSYEMFSDCSSLQELSVSSTMANIQENACQRVGSKNSPCTIYAPKGFDFGTDTSQPYFIWKSGFFVKGADIITYAVGDIITYQGLLYQVTKFGDDGNEVTLIKNPDAQGEIIIPSNIMDESGTVGFTVTAIEDYAFYNCANITKLSIPKTVRSIGIAITSCCTILNEIIVAEDNPYYDSRDNCNAVINTATGELIAGCNKTTIPEGVTAIGTEAMRGMFDLEGVVLPKTLTRIGNRAFYYCKKLTGHLAIPEGVTEVETYAFYKCTGLTAISLPSTITTMGTCAFRECTNVTWVSCYANTPPSIDSRMFGKFAGCTLMVPIGSVDTYKTATNWKKFDPIIRESVVSVEDVAILTGNKGTARISLDNGSNVYTGCQFNITLPEGTDLVKQTHGGYEYTISNRFSGTPSVQITPQDDGSYMILIYSMNNTTINGSEGVLISLPVKTNSDLSIGSYLGTVTNIAFNNPDNTSAYLKDVTFNITVPSFVLGDVNHDRTVNITDVMMTVNHVVGQTPAGFHVEDADVNGDHVINISDIMAIVNLVVNATSANAPVHAREAMTDAISLTPTTQGYAVSLQNNEPYTALQMDIQMDDDSPLTARLMDNRSDGHSIVCSDLGNGHHRIAIYSLNGNAIKGNDGILLQLETNGKHETMPEVYNVQLTNNIFENVTLSDISFPTDITIVNMEGATDAPVYNVQGIHAPKHYRGIIIQDGRKHVEKK